MQKQNWQRMIVWGVFMLLVGGYLLLALRYPHAYILATYEDLIGEWAQFYLFALTMLLAAWQALRDKRFWLFFTLLSLACLYVAGDEISWGQRLFDFPTPEFFQTHNLQQETNLHNFFTGPISTLTKQSLEYAIAVGLVGYGFFYPQLLLCGNRLAHWLERRGLAAPPLYLCPFFILAGILELGLIHFNEAEIAEILIPFALAVMTLHYRFAQRWQLEIHREQSWRSAASGLLAGQTTLTGGVIVLAFTTTLLCYQSPRLGPAMEERYLNGVEKFAGRYMRFQQWETAALLYLEIQQEEPQRASIRRNLYRCFRQLGYQQQAREQMEEAIANDLQRLKRRPESLSARISLVRNYQLLEDAQNSDKYLQDALAVGQVQKEVYPQHPGVAYWLGRSYELLGDYAAAYREFKRAANLQPDKLKYRKAQLAAGRQLEGEGRS